MAPAADRPPHGLAGTHELFEAVRSGATAEEIEGVEVVARPALTTGAADVLEADGYLLGTPANIGYMSGALKHFFDQVYYPCLTSTARRPYGLFVHGNNDATGAVRAVESITSGLEWRRVRPPVVVIGAVTKDDREACWELGATVAADSCPDHEKEGQGGEDGDGDGVRQERHAGEAEVVPVSCGWRSARAAVAARPAAKPVPARIVMAAP